MSCHAALLVLGLFFIGLGYRGAAFFAKQFGPSLKEIRDEDGKSTRRAQEIVDEWKERIENGLVLIGIGLLIAAFFCSDLPAELEKYSKAVYPLYLAAK
jgi:hypothetical protein